MNRTELQDLLKKTLMLEVIQTISFDKEKGLILNVKCDTMIKT